MGLFGNKNKNSELDGFELSKKVGNSLCALCVDYNSQQWYVKRPGAKKIHKFIDIINYNLNPITQGANTKINGNKSANTIATASSFSISITVSDRNKPLETMVVFTLTTAQEIIAELDYMMSLVQKQNEQIFRQQNYQSNENYASNSSLADELTKLKKLYDSGVITQQEFEAAKIKLLTN